VERTHARKRIRIAIVRDAHVAELRMQQPVQELPTGHSATSNARTDRDVTERVEPLARAPTMLTERSCVHIGVERNRHGQTSPDLLAYVRVSPAPAWECRDVAPLAEESFWSIGPNEPIPIASTGPSRSKKVTARPIVSSGVVVSIVSAARRSSGPLPIAHPHFDPPVSIPP
jgi:hypothetical protein